MKKFQRLVLLSLMTSLLISGFEHKLNAQPNLMSDRANAQNNNISPTLNPTHDTSPPSNELREAKISNICNNLFMCTYLFKIICDYFVKALFVYLLFSLFAFMRRKRLFWILRDDYKDIENSKKLLNKTIYHNKIVFLEELSIDLPKGMSQKSQPNKISPDPSTLVGFQVQSSPELGVLGGESGSIDTSQTSSKELDEKLERILIYIKLWFKGILKFKKIAIEQRLVEQNIIQAIGLCLEIKEENNFTQLNLIKVVRMFIELEILKKNLEENLEENLNFKNLKNKKNKNAIKEKLKVHLSNLQKNTEYVINITYQNCFELFEDTVYEKTKRYLEACKDLNLKDKNGDVSFSYSLKLENGFFAPLYLIAGPLRYFSRDWPKIIEEYERTIKFPYPLYKVPDHLPESILTLQSSIFTTWIAWGPSVPICRCPEWGGMAEQDLITIQYGFGDENNSIPILLPKNNKITFIKSIFGENVSNESIVKRANITATFSILGKLTREKLATAQTELIDKHNIEIVLKINDPKDFVLRETQSDNYYTSYVWVLFAVIKDMETNKFMEDIGKVINDINPPITHETAENIIPVWRRLLPFFEHVNIADPESYKIQKEALAYKAFHVVKQLSKQNQQSNLKFLYLCAFDHCNCKRDKAKAGLIVPQPPKSIKEILEELINEETNTANKTPIDFSTANVLPAHNLPNLIDKMNKFIEFQAQKKKKQ